MKPIDRENYKALLNCTDEEIDGLIKVVRDAAAIGLVIDLDALVMSIAKENDNETDDFNRRSDLLVLPVDIAPGPLDDIIITLAGAVVALADQKKVNHANH